MSAKLLIDYRFVNSTSQSESQTFELNEETKKALEVKCLTLKSFYENTQNLYYHILFRQIFDNETLKYEYDAILIETNYCAFQDLFEAHCDLIHEFKIFQSMFEQKYYYKIIAHTQFVSISHTTHKLSYENFMKCLSLEQQEAFDKFYDNEYSKMIQEEDNDDHYICKM